MIARFRPADVLALSLVSLVWASQASAAQRPVEYRLSFEQRAHHQARIEVAFFDLGAEPLEVVMSRSSPGRYAVHNFAKNVYDVEATNAAGQAIDVERVTPHSWRITGHGGAVVFRYTLFGDHCDGTYVAIDRSHAHLNTPAALVWARGLEQRPVRILLELPRRWRAATQLPRDRTAGRRSAFRARDLQHLLDSPIEASDHEVFEWEIAAPGHAPSRAGSKRGSSQTVRLVLHHRGDDKLLATFGRQAQAIVDEQIAVFGEPPLFDDGQYTFLADYLPWCEGDGMEHRNSTVLTSSKTLADDSIGLLGTLAHEFFHAWNVERLRPSSLEPFDFERANLSSELWFGEGFTSYYGPLTLARAGVLSLDDYLEQLSSTVSRVANSRALRHRSAAEMSRQAAFVDDATSIDPTNQSNNYLSYYRHGYAIGLALDLELRQRFGQALDDYFAELWRQFGRSEISYDQDDLVRVLGKLSGDARWADEFFERYVVGREVPNFSQLLAPAGLVVRPVRPTASWLGGARLAFDDSAIRLESPSLEGDPLYLAGIDRGDRLLELDGELPTSEEELELWLEARSPGQRISCLVTQRGESREVTIMLAADPEVEVARVEGLGSDPDPEHRLFRERWLGSRSVRVEG